LINPGRKAADRETSGLRYLLREYAAKPFPGEGRKRIEESRTAELERKAGCQAMEIGFLRRCLQRVEEERKLQALDARAFPPLTTFREGDLNEAARAADATRACEWAGAS